MAAIVGSGGIPAPCIRSNNWRRNRDQRKAGDEGWQYVAQGISEGHADERTQKEDVRGQELREEGRRDGGAEDIQAVWGGGVDRGGVADQGCGVPDQ